MPTSETPCSITDCSKKKYCRGWCRAHYGRWHRTGTPYGMRRKNGMCTYRDCKQKYFARGLCTMHYQRDRKWGDPEHTRRTDVDQIAIDRTLAGDRPEVLTLGEREECIRQLHARGCRDRAIAAMVGLTQPAVWYARQRLGLPALPPATRIGATR